MPQLVDPDQATLSIEDGEPTITLRAAPAGWDDAVTANGSVTVLASGTRIVASALAQSSEES
ncbi:MAG: hypothetical protein ABIW49_10435 [Knoellia sp.]